MRYTDARELIEAALDIINEDEQTDAQYAHMGRKIAKATERYHTGERGSETALRNLVKKNIRQQESSRLYGRGGKILKRKK